MARYITLENEKKRDASVTFKSLTPKPTVFLALESGEPVTSKRVLKGTVATSSSRLLQTVEARHQGNEASSQTDAPALLAEDLILNDPEIEMELVGRFLDDIARVYVNPEGKPLFSVRKEENIFSPQGELKEQRPPQYFECNISGIHKVKWTGKYIPKAKMYNKLVFAKKYQIRHVNGLTYDFLFDMAQQLSNRQAFMMLGGGPAGKDPLVMMDGGKPYRCFLEGRVQGDSYCLIMHLTDQELKPIPQP